MDQDQLKRSAAHAALAHIEPMLDAKSIVGVGTGSTTNFFIDALGTIKHKFDAAVSSSEASSARLKAQGIPVLDLNAAADVAVYVDGADETNRRKQLIKGGGGALTREKIVAASANAFICIVDESKVVDTLGRFPLPIEVIPMARGLVARAVVNLGGAPELRGDFVTDNGNLILDVHDLQIHDPEAMETAINNMVGVVCCGVFAAQAASEVIVAYADGSVALL